MTGLSNDLYGKSRKGGMRKYECQVCGYIYDEEVGDPRGDVEPNFPFDDVSGEWRCPWCDAERENFEPYVI